MKYPLLYLASKSPRRHQLLRDANIPFTLLDLDVDESYPPGTPLEEIAEVVAEKKARAGLQLIREGVILAADSIVIVDDVVFGKPEDTDHARKMLSKLSGRQHTVITGCCLLSHDRMKRFSDLSTVHMDFLQDSEIEYYIQHFRPFDKAGAYAIQEWIGLCKIKRIEGTYTNIMGLPVHMVYDKLRGFV